MAGIFRCIRRKTAQQIGHVKERVGDLAGTPIALCCHNPGDD